MIDISDSDIEREDAEDEKCGYSKHVLGMGNR